MRITFISLALLSFLAACGADGDPTPPEPQTGVTISGSARIGVAGKL